nr:skin secretory protein xP2-like [Marmota flaviventris]
MRVANCLWQKKAGAPPPPPARGWRPSPTRDRRLEARRRDSDRGSLEEEPEVAAGCSSPGEGRARGGSDPGRRREGLRAEAEGRGLRSCPWSGTRTGRVGRRASEPRSRACCPRVQRPRAPSPERGRRAEAVAPGRCLGPDRLHVSPAPGHVHQLSPVRRLDVLRINKMKLRRADSSRFSESPTPDARPPPAPLSRRSPSNRPEPAGQVATSARPRPPAPPRRPRGALPQSLIKKVARLTLPKVVVACAPLSLPAPGAALGYAPRRGPAREGCSRNQELLGPAREGGGRASIRGRGEGGGRARGVPSPALLLGTAPGAAPYFRRVKNAVMGVRLDPRSFWKKSLRSPGGRAVGRLAGGGGALGRFPELRTTPT